MTSNFILQTSYLRRDERNHVEKPVLDQLTGKVCVTPLLTKPQEGGA